MSLALIAWSALLALVVAGSAIQVAVGAGLSVVCGPFVLLWLGPGLGVPLLLCLNLLVSLVATLCGGLSLRWSDVALASLATLAGCVVAAALPSLPDAVLKALTAFVLVAVALPPPPVPDRAPSPRSAVVGVMLAGAATGAVTVWTATPGPIIPIALARMGRSGAEIRRAMQPISIVGYGVALAWTGAPAPSALGHGTWAAFIAATLLGTGLGFRLRTRIEPGQVVALVRVVAALAAALLVASLFVPA